MRLAQQSWKAINNYIKWVLKAKDFITRSLFLIQQMFFSTEVELVS